MDVFFLSLVCDNDVYGKNKDKVLDYIDILRIFVLSMIMNHLFVVFIVTDSFIGLLFHENI